MYIFFEFYVRFLVVHVRIIFILSSFVSVCWLFCFGNMLNGYLYNTDNPQ